MHNAVRPLVTVSHQCTQNFMDLDRIKLIAPLEDKMISELNNQIRILEEYQFNCTTNVTMLKISVSLDSKRRKRMPNNNNDQLPTIQRWTRQNGNNYVLDTSSTLEINTNGVSNYTLDPPILVNSGDLLAISQPRRRNTAVMVNYIEGLNFKSHRVMFNKNTAALNNPPDTNIFILVYPITGSVKLIIINHK